MKVLFLSVLLFGFSYVDGQHFVVGQSNNVGREYGNPKMPWVVSHLAGANREMLKRVNKNSRHSFFGKILCFRKLCRIQSGHTASLHAISFKKFRKKIRRNAKKGLYRKIQVDSTYKRKPVATETTPVATDTATAPLPAPVIKADTLIVLGAELLFETDKSTLKSEHFAMLSPIVDYLVSHPERSVKISGHTDDTGSEQHNLALSKRRADVVAEYLVDNGIDASRLETFGLGSAKPIAANANDEGRRKNRRVELLIQDGR
jgi:outer membrane protein OmpA-like peptidoglycan-associated protein